MLCFQAIGWIRWMANRVRRPKTGLFSTSIDAVVTLSITVGMAVVLIAVMVMLGFQKEIRKKITAFAGDFEITSYGNRQNAYELAPLQAAQVRRLMVELPSFIEKVTPFTQKIMLMHAKGGVEALLCKGIDAMVADKALADYLILGRLPAVGNLVYPRELCISHDLAQQLSIQLGDNVVVHTLHPTVRYRKLKVVGIYCTYLKDIDQNLAFCDRRLIQRLNNWSPETVNGYTIFLKDDLSPTNALKEAILPLIDQDLVLVSTRRKYASFYDWLLILQKNTAIFILFILLIAGFTMVATVMIQLMERSYMIGILKVLGAYDWQVHAILLYNGLRTLCFGMVYGNIIGMGLCFLQARYRCITLEPALYYMRYVPIYINWQTIASLNLLIIGVLVVALYMAIKLLKQQKLVEALADH